MALWIFALFLVFWNGQGRASGDNCESAVTTRCLTSASQKRFVFPDTLPMLKEHCKHLLSDVQCVRRVVDECGGERSRSMFINLTLDIMHLNTGLCTPGAPLNTQFLRHVDCYRDLSERFRICHGRFISNTAAVTHNNAEEQTRMTCCSVHEYSRCMLIAVEGRCEVEAQKLVEDSVAVAFRQLIIHCRQLSNLPVSNCMESLSASLGHATGNKDESGSGRGGGVVLAPFCKAVVFVLFVLLAS